MNELLAQFFSAAHVAWTRRRIAVGVAWLVCLFGWSFVAVMPDIYRASAIIYLDTETILRPLLRGLAVESNIDSEIDLMQRTLTSRPNLEEVLRQTDQDLSTRSRAETEVLIDKMQSRIQVASTRGNLFTISFEDNNPRRARDIVQALISIFVESNLGQSRQDMDTARRFIEDQIKVYEQKLEDAERRLAEFRQENLGVISVSQDGAFQIRLEQAQANLEQVKGELRDAELRRATLRRELESVPQFLPSGTAGGAGPPTNIEVQILQLETQLEDLLSRYTDQHPDVVVARRRLETLYGQQRQEIERAADAAVAGNFAPGPVSGLSNPVYEQLKVQLVDEEAKIAALRSRLAKAQQWLDEMQQEANRVPELQAELTKLNRDYGVLQNRHQQLISRREDERISRARELEAEEVKFRILQAPEVPVRPSGPNRYIFLTFVLLVGVASGTGVALLLGLSGDTFVNPAQLKEAFPFPVIGTVSRSEFAAASAATVLRSGIFWLTALGLFAIFSGLVLVEWKLGVNRVVSGEVLTKLPADWLRLLPRF